MLVVGVVEPSARSSFLEDFGLGVEGYEALLLLRSAVCGLRDILYIWLIIKPTSHKPADK